MLSGSYCLAPSPGLTRALWDAVFATEAQDLTWDWHSQAENPTKLDIHLTCLFVRHQLGVFRASSEATRSYQ